MNLKIDSKDFNKNSIREMKLSDLDQVSMIHLKVFKGFFISKLGYKFTKNYYKELLNYQEHIALVAHNEEKIIGFATGIKNRNLFYKSLWKSLWKFLVYSLPNIFLKPTMLIDVIFNFFRIRKFKSFKNYNSGIELTSIAANPNNIGLGTKLLRLFEEEAKKKNIISVTLKTDKNQNEKVLSFYKKNKYTIEHFEKYNSRELVYLIKYLN